MNDFVKFRSAVSARLDAFGDRQLFNSGISGDDLWKLYLASFPEGTNVVFRKRAEFDCNCCRNFVKNLGRVVWVNNGFLVTVWDDLNVPEPFATVARSLSAAVKGGGVSGVFVTSMKSFGVTTNRDSAGLQWSHFYGSTPKQSVCIEVDKVAGAARQNQDLLLRSLRLLTKDSLQDVLDLIDQDGLYRGKEARRAVESFLGLKKLHDDLPADKQELLAWSNHGAAPEVHFKNSSIGSLVEDLSTGKEIEAAVASYEKKVAPENYKRPKEVVTSSMVASAMKTIEGLELEASLERRHATEADLSVNDVLFVDNSTRPNLKGGIAALLEEAVVSPDAKLKNIKEISANDFFNSVVPGLTAMSVVLKSNQLGNLMSVTAPAKEDTKALLDWENDFAWSYRGELADSSLRARVAELGGRVDGVLRFTHSWNQDGQNQSLMDLHVVMPDPARPAGDKGTQMRTGPGIYRRVCWYRRTDTLSGGAQDVDFVHAPGDKVPVENITFPNLKKLPEGLYRFLVNNWSERPPCKSGFIAEIEANGVLYQYSHPEPVRNHGWVEVATAVLKDGVFTFDHKLKPSALSKKVWGIETEKLEPVALVMKSPNHWGNNKKGLLHHFFILKKAVNPEPVRGFYNEFLSTKLREHRKVFEVLSAKTKIQPSDKQLSGVGFTEGRGDSLLVLAQGPRQHQAYQVKF